MCGERNVVCRMFYFLFQTFFPNTEGARCQTVVAFFLCFRQEAGHPSTRDFKMTSPTGL
jgi:hypothetical protein